MLFLGKLSIWATVAGAKILVTQSDLRYYSNENYPNVSKTVAVYVQFPNEPDTLQLPYLDRSILSKYPSSSTTMIQYLIDFCFSGDFANRYRIKIVRTRWLLESLYCNECISRNEYEIVPSEVPLVGNGPSP